MHRNKRINFTGNSNGNESPCNNELTTNNLQHIPNQWSVSPARNQSPGTLANQSLQIGQIPQSLALHGQGLGNFPQGTLHNPGLHGYGSHNPSKMHHQPFYGWY